MFETSTLQGGKSNKNGISAHFKPALGAQGSPHTSSSYIRFVSTLNFHALSSVSLYAELFKIWFFFLFFFFSFCWGFPLVWFPAPSSDTTWDIKAAFYLPPPRFSWPGFAFHSSQIKTQFRFYKRILQRVSKAKPSYCNFPLCFLLQSPATQITAQKFPKDFRQPERNLHFRRNRKCWAWKSLHPGALELQLMLVFPSWRLFVWKDEPSVPSRVCKYDIKIYFRALQCAHKWMRPIPLHKYLVFTSKAKPLEAPWV